MRYNGFDSIHLYKYVSAGLSTYITYTIYVYMLIHKNIHTYIDTQIHTCTKMHIYGVYITTQYNPRGGPLLENNHLYRRPVSIKL